MSVEFVDTNVPVYAHDGGAGDKYVKSCKLLSRSIEEQSGAISIQVLTEFYHAAIRKLGMKSQEAEEIIADLGSWTTHRPEHADVIRASRLHRCYKLAWWDALILNSAIELGCRIVWTEDLTDGQRYGPTTVRNPFL